MKITHAITPPTTEFTASTPVVNAGKTVQVFIGNQAVTFGIGNGEQRTAAFAFFSENHVNNASVDGTPKFSTATGEQKAIAQTWVRSLTKD